MGFLDDILGTNIFGDNSTDKAIDAQMAGADAANATQLEMYNQTRDDQTPWREAGMGALSDLTTGLGEGGQFTQNFSQQDFKGDPGYQFRMDEGLKAIDASAAARGGLNSGATLKALTKYGQGFASNEYQNAYNRYNNDQSNQFNRLSSLAGVGQQANTQLANANQSYGNSVASNQIGTGNAIASANIAQANRTGQFVGQMFGAGAQAMSSPSTAAAFSDKRLKTNINPINKTELMKLRKSIKPYMYNYVNDEFGEGDWVGVMAQDLAKSKLGKTVVFEDENGHKKVELNKLLSLMVASMAEGGN